MFILGFIIWIFGFFLYNMDDDTSSPIGLVLICFGMLFMIVFGVNTYIIN